MNRLTCAVLVSVATFVTSFVLTNILYIEWAVWRYPDANSMAGLSAFVLGLLVAPICALVTGVLVFGLRKKDSIST